jgi:hypothetical protein
MAEAEKKLEKKSAETVAEKAAAVRQVMNRLSKDQSLQAWALYLSGQEDRALELWEKRAKETGPGAMKALRGLAVVWHSRAYDLELEGKKEEAGRAWQHALKLWARLFACEGFGALLREIAHVDDEVFLELEDVEPLQEVLVECLVAPNLALMVAALKAGDPDHALRHLVAVRESGLPVPVVQGKLRELAREIAPIRTGEITHTSIRSQERADDMEVNARFVSEHFPEDLAGHLALLEIWIWRAADARAQAKVGILKKVWKDLEALDRNGVLERVQDMGQMEPDPVLQGLVRTRLREVANGSGQVLTEYEYAIYKEASDGVDEYNRLSRSGTRPPHSLVQRIVNTSKKYLQFVKPGQLDRCQDLCDRFGGGGNLGDVRESRRVRIGNCQGFLESLDGS